MLNLIVIKFDYECIDALNINLYFGYIPNT